MTPIWSRPDNHSYELDLIGRRSIGDELGKVLLGGRPVQAD